LDVSIFLNAMNILRVKTFLKLIGSFKKYQ